jgi:hypothetical protein
MWQMTQRAKSKRRRFRQGWYSRRPSPEPGLLKTQVKNPQDFPNEGTLPGGYVFLIKLARGIFCPGQNGISKNFCKQGTCCKKKVFPQLKLKGIGFRDNKVKLSRRNINGDDVPLVQPR